jgi:hypothetical protein
MKLTKQQEQEAFPQDEEDGVKEYNQRMADEAEDVLVAYASGKGESEELPEYQLSDLLADLRHYARLNNLDWETIDERARMHFNAEVSGEQEPEGTNSVTPAPDLTGEGQFYVDLRDE